MSRTYRKVLIERDLLAAAAPPLSASASPPNASASASASDASASASDASASDSEGSGGGGGGGLGNGSNAFAALMAGQAEDSSLPESDSSDSDTPHLLPLQATTPANAQKPKKSAKSKGKKRGKGKGKTTVESSESPRHSRKHINDSDDEVERALREVNAEYGLLLEQVSSTRHSSHQTSNTRALLATDIRMLDPEAEMKRMFGSRVVDPSENRTNRRATARSATPRTHLATPKPSWPRFDKLGLEMQSVAPVNTDPDSAELDKRLGVSYFSFTHSSRYMDLQIRFFQCIQTYDPNTIMGLLNMYPYHIDSLIQMSQISLHNGDHQMAFELIERALYAFERGFHPLFHLTSGTVRLEYARFENRAFHLAVFQYIQNLGRRGCWRTAFELTKLLLSLDSADPLSALLTLDFYALKCREFDWFLRAYDEKKTSLGLDLLPCFRFGVALATWMKEEEFERIKKRKTGSNSSLTPELEESVSDDPHEKSSLLLVDAILWFPNTVSAMLEKCGISDSAVVNNIFFSYLGSGTPETSSEAACKLLIDLFVSRSFTLWKEPDILSWFRSTLASLVHSLSSPTQRMRTMIKQGIKIRQTKYQGVPANIYRHLIVSESRITSLSHLGEIQAHDPFPPEISLPSPYDNYFREQSRARFGGMDVSSRGAAGVLEALVRTMAPWVNVNAGGVDGAANVGGAANAGGLLARIRPEEQRAVEHAMRELGMEPEVLAGFLNMNHGEDEDGQEEVVPDERDNFVPGMFPEGGENADRGSLRDVMGVFGLGQEEQRGGEIGPAEDNEEIGESGNENTDDEHEHAQ